MHRIEFRLNIGVVLLQLFQALLKTVADCLKGFPRKKVLVSLGEGLPDFGHCDIKGP